MEAATQLHHQLDRRKWRIAAALISLSGLVLLIGVLLNTDQEGPAVLYGMKSAEKNMPLPFRACKPLDSSTTAKICVKISAFCVDTYLRAIAS